MTDWEDLVGRRVRVSNRVWPAVLVGVLREDAGHAGLFYVETDDGREVAVEDDDAVEGVR